MLKSSMNQLYMVIRHWIGLILRPRLTLLRIREARQARMVADRTVRPDIPINSLPEITLIPVTNKKDLQKQLLRLFQSNPSPLALAPRNRKTLAEEFAKGTQYYLAINKLGEIVGCTGFQPWRNMSVNTTIDYKHRGKGYGLNISKELFRLKTDEGLTEIWGLVFKGNKRALSGCLSLGYCLVPELEGPQYYTLVKKLVQNKKENS